jgi:hypothetical protein
MKKEDLSKSTVKFPVSFFDSTLHTRMHADDNVQLREHERRLMAGEYCMNHTSKYCRSPNPPVILV